MTIPTDTGYPNVGQRVTPEGRIEAVFPGGVEIPAAALTEYLAGNSIRWLQGDTPIGLATTVRDDSAQRVTTLQFEARTLANPDRRAELVLYAAETPGFPVTTESMVNAVAWDGSGGFSAARLIDSDGASSFLQLVSAGALAIDYGTGSADFTGSAPNESSSGVIAHSLGRTPAIVLAHPLPSGSIRFNATYQGLDASDADTAELAWQLNNDVQASGTLDFAWLAIG